MESKSRGFVVENGLNLRNVVTTGSILHINHDFDEIDLQADQNQNAEHLPVDVLGQPVPSFERLSESLVAVNETGYVKKKIIEEGGGLPLHEGCTVSIAFSGYWENVQEPFDVVPIIKPMVVDLNDNGLLPGLQIAIRSMLVGEISVFLLTYQVMYGEMGIPPRIKPKADCVFYIKISKSILTPKEGKIVYSEPNMFQRVQHEVKLLFSSGSTLYKTNNYMAAIQLFKKAVNMLHRCRLADEKEEMIQEKLLKKLYINLLVCYNQAHKPLLACIACNELHRLKSLWNNHKVLFQNAKALRMIGDYANAQKKLNRAMTLHPGSNDMQAEYDLLQRTWKATMEAKKNADLVKKAAIGQVSDEFKQEIDDLIRNFKTSADVQLVLPSHFNSEETAYFKEACFRENIFFNILDRSELPKYEENLDNNLETELFHVLHKKEARNCSVKCINLVEE